MTQNNQENLGKSQKAAKQGESKGSPAMLLIFFSFILLIGFLAVKQQHDAEHESIRIHANQIKDSTWSSIAMVKLIDYAKVHAKSMLPNGMSQTCLDKIQAIETATKNFLDADKTKLSHSDAGSMWGETYLNKVELEKLLEQCAKIPKDKSSTFMRREVQKLKEAETEDDEETKARKEAARKEAEDAERKQKNFENWVKYRSQEYYKEKERKARERDYQEWLDK